MSTALSHSNHVLPHVFHAGAALATEKIGSRDGKLVLLASHYYRRQWAAYTALPLLMMVGQALYTARPEPADVTGMVKLPYLSWLYPSEFGYVALFLLCVLVSYYFIGNTFYTEHRLYLEQQKQQNFKFQAEALAKRCGTYQTAQDNTRRIRHDIRYHVTVLTGLLADGRVGDAQDYLVRLSNMVEELGSIEMLKTDFISNVSHEMKTPTAVIKNAAQMLQLGTLTEEEKTEYAKAIDSAAATYHFVYPAGFTRIYRLDITLFSVSKDCGKANK